MITISKGATMDQLKEIITRRIDELSDELLAVSHSIHANPELAFQEHHACELLRTTAEKNDLPVTTGVYTLETAFETSFSGSSDGPTVAILAEYDALPGIGHSCGHKEIV